MVRIKILNEFGDDARDESLELFVVMMLFGVQNAVAMNHPAHVAGLMEAEEVTGISCRFFPGLVTEKIFDCVHGAHKASLILGRKGAQHGADLFIGAAVERCKGFAAARGQREKALTPVGGGPLPVDEAAPGEVTEDAAEVAGVEAEVAGDSAGRGIFQARYLVQYAAFGERESTAQETLVEDADALGIKTVEVANGFDAPRENKID